MQLAHPQAIIGAAPAGLRPAMHLEILKHPIKDFQVRVVDRRRADELRLGEHGAMQRWHGRGRGHMLTVGLVMIQ
jgi:hypothetical protein